MKDKKFGIAASIFLMLAGYFLAALLADVLILFTGLITIVGPLNDVGVIICFSLIMCILISVYYFWLSNRKSFNPVIITVNAWYVMIVTILFTVFFVISKASLLSPLMSAAAVLAFPFCPVMLFIALFSGSYSIMITVGITLIYSLIFTALLTKRNRLLKASFVCFFCSVLCVFTYLDSPHYKYRSQNHGFAYMGGYSSIDLSDYTPFSESGKLAKLNHQPELIIENEDEMPVLDGAEACYPVYSAVAKAIYKDIDKIELEYRESMEGKYDENGKIVTFYNTAVGFERLLNGDADMFFGAKPSQSQLKLAQEMNVELEYTPIGKEAFVFFVNENNVIDELSSDEIRSIYTGEITNWKELKGRNEEIIAFQRPERSGSQSMMIHFMKDVPLKEPLTYEMEYAMMGIIEEVAEYHNESGAIGYSFRYFLEGLNQVENVKMLSVDGVYPTKETIQNGTYPIITSLYCITVKGNENENVQKVLDFLLSEDGQTLIEKTGYIPLK